MVPSARFEPVVSELETVGDITRQQLLGQDLTSHLLDVKHMMRRAQNRAAGLVSQAQRSKDETGRAGLLEDLRQTREELRGLREEKSYVATQSAYSSVDVSLTSRKPVTPQKPPLERALLAAKTISLSIASGVVLAAGVLVPIGVLLLTIYLVTTLVLRRVRPRLEG
jgi:VIT1/CCC1 family predicted Fe2+/Mn2+ transporter